METAANNTSLVAFINILIFILFIAGIIILQVFLSKRQSKWLGLILPGISFIVSIFAVMSTAVFTNITKQSVQTISENGKVVNEIINHVQEKNNVDLASVILTIIVVFIMFNISTAILLAIYAACREKRRKNLELEKMNIQDLE